MKRSKHSLSNYHLTTMDMGKLVPVQLQEVLPGDTFRMQSSAFIRMSPMLAPVMHPVTVRLHHWFVPMRLLWDGWEDFITGQSSDTIPTLSTVSGKDTISDYFGIPHVADDPVEVNALPFRAYNMIWNEFYRDQDLEAEIDLNITTLSSVSWRKDYFTAARPWPQKGPDITLPIGDQAPLVSTSDPAGFKYPDGTEAHMVTNADGNSYLTPGPGSDGNDTYFSGKGLVADLSHATGVTATEFREFFALQRYAEARARYGSRYTEYLRYLGVSPSDARLQRPEYLGGGKTTLQISEVLQTAADTLNNTPIGTLRGHGISALRAKTVRRFFEEHGYILTLMSVVPKSVYADGVDRTFWRQDKEDFYQKELQSIGQQSVLQGEVYAKEPANVREVFGYSDRYAEYTTARSHVTGDFRTDLDFWHLARKFDSAPALNESFTKCNPSKRIFADQTGHSLWCAINNSVVARRLVKKVSVGRLL